MQIGILTLGLICAMQNVYAMKGIAKAIHKKIQYTRDKNNIDVTLIPKGFDSENWGEIIGYNKQHDAHQQNIVTYITHTGGAYFYDETIKDDKPIGWCCILSRETPKEFEQHFNIADIDWKQQIFDSIAKNDYSNFIYHHPSQTCIYSVNNAFNNKFKSFIIEQKQQQQMIPFPKRKNKEGNELLSQIDAIALNKDGHYCAYGMSHLCPLQSYSYTSVKVLKKSDVGLYENANDILTKGDNANTQEFDLTQGASLCNIIYLENVQFLSNNTLKIRTVVTGDEAHLWTITAEGLKIKQQCMLDIGDNNIQPLGKIYSSTPHTRFFDLYKKIISSTYRYKIDDPRFLVFINILKDRNSDSIAQEEKISLPKEIYAKILHTLYTIDPILRENTQLIYNLPKKI